MNLFALFGGIVLAAYALVHLIRTVSTVSAVRVPCSAGVITARIVFFSILVLLSVVCFNFV